MIHSCNISFGDFFASTSFIKVSLVQLLRVNVTFNDWTHYFPINKENKNTQKQKIMRKHGSRKVSGP